MNRAADTVVLVSMHPQHAQRIASGEKTVELRRRFPRLSQAWMVIYATKPVGRIVGVARIGRVDQAPPEVLWRRHRKVIGIVKDAFDAYLAGCETGCAVELDAFYPCPPMPLEDLRVEGLLRAPQSYRYLPFSALVELDIERESTGVNDD